MRIIDAKGAILGRLSSYVAKLALKGENIIVVNCEEIIITGNKKDIKDKLGQRRKRTGSSQKGPKYSILPEKIVKRAIRGMLPNHRRGRGKIAYRKIRCYVGVPEELKEEEKESFKKINRNKFLQIRDVIR